MKGHDYWQYLISTQNVFSETPGFCDLIQHEIHVSDQFRPKRLRSYRVPENLKPKVEEQIQELLRLGIIKSSKIGRAHV